MLLCLSASAYCFRLLLTTCLRLGQSRGPLRGIAQCRSSLRERANAILPASTRLERQRLFLPRRFEMSRLPEESVLAEEAAFPPADCFFALAQNRGRRKSRVPVPYRGRFSLRKLRCCVRLTWAFLNASSFPGSPEKKKRNVGKPLWERRQSDGSYRIAGRFRETRELGCVRFGR